MSQSPEISSQEYGPLITESNEFEVIHNPYERMEYVHLTDELIHRMEGSEEKPAPDYVVFLDKSARPVSWMVRELWNDLARQPGTDYEDNVIPERPGFCYANVDSRHMFTHDDIPDLRSLFLSEVPDDAVDFMEQESIFAGKNILVVDEIGVSHATIVKAKAYFELAFPDAKDIDTFVWMDQGEQTNFGGQGAPPRIDKETLTYTSDSSSKGFKPRSQNNNLRWYHDRSRHTSLPLDKKRQMDDGRGVIDSDAAYTGDEAHDGAPGKPNELSQLDNPRTKHGKQWLSVIPSEPLPEATGLRHDIKRMAEEIRSEKLPYWPANGRDDYVERIAHFNGDITPQDFTDFRSWFKDKWWGTYDLAPVRALERRPSKNTPTIGGTALKLAQKFGLTEQR